MKIIKFLAIFLGLIVFLSFNTKTFAENTNDFLLSIQPKEIYQNDEFYVEVKILNDLQKNITAIKGEFYFDENKIKPQKIITGQSDFKIWLEEPSISDNKITFSGLAPGGLNEAEMQVFGIVFTAIKNGETELKNLNSEIYIDAGNKSEFTPKDFPIKIISSDNNERGVINEIVITDTIPPQEFSPIILRDLEYQGSVHLAFSAIDLETGISHLEVLFSPINYSEETLQNNKNLVWQKIESPYLIDDKKQNNYIYLKAIDKNDNQRLVIIPPIKEISTQDQISSAQIILIVFFIILIIYFLFIHKRLFKKNKNDIIIKE